MHQNKVKLFNKKKVTAALLIAALGITTAYSVTAGPLDDIAVIQQQQEAVYAELEQIQASINDLEQKKNAVLSQIDTYDAQLVTTIATINTLETQIKDKEEELKNTAEQLEKAEADEQKQYEAMKDRIQYMYEQGGDLGLTAVLLGTTGLGSVLNRAQETQELYDYDRAELEKYTETTVRIEKLQAEQRKQKSMLLEMKRTQTEVQKKLEELKEQAQKTSANYDEQLTQAGEQAVVYQQLIEQQNAEIARLQEVQRQIEEAARIAAEQEAARQAAAAWAAQQAAEQAAYEQQMAWEAQQAAMYSEQAYTEEYYYDDSAAYGYDESAAYGYDESAGYGYDDSAAYGYDESAAYGYDESADYGYDDSAAYGYDDSAAYTDTGYDAGYEDYSYDTGYDDYSYDAGYTDTAAVTDYSYTPSSDGSLTGQDIANYALQFVGNPYVWGGTDLVNGADCSGFVQSVYGDNGISLSRTTYTQMNEGTPVSYDEMQPGDVINYGYHTAIYLGDNQIVHAADESLGIIVSDNPAFEPIVTIRRFV